MGAEKIPDFCDMCGKDLDTCDVDYKVVIEVISGEVRRDLADMSDGNPAAEIQELIRAADQKSDAELMDEIYRKMFFRICPACQKEYLKNPIQRNFKGTDNDQS